MIETKASSTRQAPAWLMMLILLLSLGGAGALTYYVMRTPPKPAPIVSDLPPTPLQPNGRPQGNWKGTTGGAPSFFTRAKSKFTGGADRIEPLTSRHGYRIKAGNLVVSAMDPNAPKPGTAPSEPAPTGPVQFTFSFVPLWADVLSHEQFELHSMCLAVASRADTGQVLHLTPQQVQQVRAGLPLLKPDASELTALRTELNAYTLASAAEKDSAEKAVLAAVQAIYAAHAPALKQAALAEGNTLKQALTSEQFAALKRDPTGRTAPVAPATAAVKVAATAPATRP